MILLSMVACLNPLRPTQVDSIPPGNATGTAHSGFFGIMVRTTACVGSCPGAVIDESSWSCEVDDQREFGGEVLQSEGALEIEWMFPFQQLSGSLDDRGRFDIGGLGTREDGDSELVLRAEGTFPSVDAFEGTARGRAEGDNGDECDAEYTFSGERLVDM